MSEDPLNSCELERIIRQYAPMIFRLALTYMKKRELAEDILQEVSVELVKRKREFADEAHLKAWLIRVTVNKCHSFARCKNRHSEILVDTLDYQSGVGNEKEGGVSAEDAQEIWSHVLSLPFKLSQVLLMYYADDCSTREIARLLHLRESSVRARLTRARRALRKLMEQNDRSIRRSGVMRND